MKEIKFISVQRAAMIFDLSERAVYELIQSGQLKAHKLGPRKGFRIATGDVESYIEQSVYAPMTSR